MAVKEHVVFAAQILKCIYLITKRHQTLNVVFTSVYRLEIQSVMLVFSTSFVNCCPSYCTSLWLALSPSPPFPVWLSILYKRIQCVKGGEYGFRGGAWDRQKTCRKFPLQVNLLDLALLSISHLSFFLRLHMTPLRISFLNPAIIELCCQRCKKEPCCRQQCISKAVKQNNTSMR